MRGSFARAPCVPELGLDVVPSGLRQAVSEQPEHRPWVVARKPPCRASVEPAANGGTEHRVRRGPLGVVGDATRGTRESAIEPDRRKKPGPIVGRQARQGSDEDEVERVVELGVCAVVGEVRQRGSAESDRDRSREREETP
jgi:hypothetical protein